MSITLPKYDLDVFGTNPVNYIKNEKVLIADNCPYLIPDGAPFFIKDVVITTETGSIIPPTKYKLRGHQYFLDLIEKTGQKVSGFVEITDTSILQNNTHLLMTYRTVGKYYIPRNKVPEWLEMIKNAGEGLTFDKLLRLPDLFPINHHIHSAVTEVGDYFELSDFFRMLLGSRMNIDPQLGQMIDDEVNQHHQRVVNTYQQYLTAVNTHARNYNNAHGITKAMLGLGLVENFKTATIADELSGESQQVYSTPFGVRSKITENVNNNVSFLENGVFPISYLNGLTCSVAGRVLTINPGCIALINGTKYQMPSGTIDFADVGIDQHIAYLVATVQHDKAIWVITTSAFLESDNYSLTAAELSVTSTTLTVARIYTPFLIANYEVTDELSKPASILCSSGLPMDKGVYRVQEKYIQNDPYA